MVRLRRQARRAERLARRVRGAWQEKLLALRMQTLFGRRFVAILENTVLVLILVLFVLIAAQVVLERASPSGLSVRAARVLRLDGPGHLLGVPLRVRSQAGARSQQDDLFRPPLRDRPGGLAPVWLCLSSDCPRNNSRMPRVGTGPPSGPFRRCHPCRAGVSPVHQGGPADPQAGARGADPVEAERSPGAPHGRAAQSQHRLVRALADAEVRVERPPSPGDLTERARARAEAPSRPGSIATSAGSSPSV